MAKSEKKKYLPLPRLYTTPASVNNKACSLPQATEVICLVRSIGLNTRADFVSLLILSGSLSTKPACPLPALKQTLLCKFCLNPINTSFYEG